ncbi:MAG: response regulator transcription factor [Flavobacteriaceae bacterium]|nr:response regulator transcription factor [Flavobacteriaceae bacterium]
MSISCLVIEDNVKASERIGDIVSSNFSMVTQLDFAYNLEETRAHLESHTPQLIVSDIHLGDGQVFEVFKEFPSLNSKIIFTTSHSEHAIEAFKFSALSYLLKPFTSEELISEINKTIAIINQENYHKQMEVLLHNLNTQQKSQRIVLKNHDLIHVVEIDTILYAQADNNYTHFYCEDRKVLVSKSLKTFEEQLSPYNFFRCHHSYLINLKKVKALHKSGDAVILSDESNVPVASSKKKILYSLIG